MQASRFGRAPHCLALLCSLCLALLCLALFRARSWNCNSICNSIRRKNTFRLNYKHSKVAFARKLSLLSWLRFGLVCLHASSASCNLTALLTAIAANFELQTQSSSDELCAATANCELQRAERRSKRKEIFRRRAKF